MCFIDGFNLYHSIDNSAALKKYKWLDLWALTEKLMMPNETLVDVLYFTAYTYWNNARKARHSDYVFINEDRGCKVILGKFQEKERFSSVKCSALCAKNAANGYCGKKFIAHEEKMTDVNIAINILKACIMSACDAIYLISGDNDLVPALEAVKWFFPEVRIRVLLPVNAKAKNLMNTCNKNGFKYQRIKEHHLASSQFPNPVIIKGNSYFKPMHWI